MLSWMPTKKIDLDNPVCLNESKVMENILQNHLLRFNIAASSSVPWIYLGKFWHTLKEDGSKYRLKFVLDRKEITMTLNDFKRIFQLPQAINNNHECFVAAPNFLKMAPFFLNDLGFTLELTSRRQELSQAKVKEHLIDEEIEKLVEGIDNVENNELVNSVLNCGDQESLNITMVRIKKIRGGRVSRGYELRRREKRNETRFLARKKFNVLAQHLQEVMEESLPNMVDDRVKELSKTQVPIYVAHGLIMERQQSQADVAKMIADAIQQKHENLRAKITSESSSGQVNESEPGLSTLGNQEQLDDFDFWTDSYATYDDELPTEKKRDFMFTISTKANSRVQSCQKDPKAHALSFVNEDLLYFKKGNSGPKKIVSSIYKFPAVIFLDDDIEERTSRWLGVERYQQKVNLTALKITFYGIERVLEGLKSYNNDVKHGYVTPSLSKEDVEYLQLFEEEIKERLKHRGRALTWQNNLVYARGQAAAMALPWEDLKKLLMEEYCPCKTQIWKI
uniref:Uncharacterized protein n=1 Tax=Tanacetum cinerariifolium TaxID=118510 RepID=A0A6L2MTS3_TANCI|nr:hypothetical protein [Tanacetum cinerariifolium]